MTPTIRCSLLAFALSVPVGCGGSTEKVIPKTPEGQALQLVVTHEPCDVGSSNAQKTDINGDGKPDIVRVMSGGREVCRMIDFNHDGLPDTWMYFDEQGRLRRRESDFDRDGRIDEVATFVNGEIVEKDRETTLDGKFDTWDFYRNGKLDHRLRDSTGDGKVDEWWTWPSPDRTECAVIATDQNADGQPDPESAVDQCAAAPTTQPTPTAVASDAGAAAPVLVPAPDAAAPAVAPAKADAGKKGAR
jgi:hypothetical protein